MGRNLVLVRLSENIWSTTQILRSQHVTLNWRGNRLNHKLQRTSWASEAFFKDICFICSVCYLTMSLNRQERGIRVMRVQKRTGNLAWKASYCIPACLTAVAVKHLERRKDEAQPPARRAPPCAVRGRVQRSAAGGGGGGPRFLLLQTVPFQPKRISLGLN